MSSDSTMISLGGIIFRTKQRLRMNSLTIILEPLILTSQFEE